MIVFIILAFASAVIVHEVAHGWAADRLGDPTARLAGRLTLNPIPHIDLVGTIIVPLMLFLFGSPFVIGWAKPVPVDPYNLKNPRKDSALISLAGPFSNLLMAVAAAVLIRIVPSISQILIYFVVYNIALAIFNLIPIHPLDGGKILVGILPSDVASNVDNFLERFGMILLFFLIFPIFGGRSLISPIISPIISFLINFLAPGMGL